jgi:hypothetical protein
MKVDGFTNIEVGARVIASVDFFHIRGTGHDHHRQFLQLFAASNVFQNFKTGQAGKIQIQQNHITLARPRIGGKLFNGFYTILGVGNLNRHAGLLQRRAQHMSVGGIVFDEKNAQHASR